MKIDKMASLPSSHAEAVAPPADNTLASAGNNFNAPLPGDKETLVAGTTRSPDGSSLNSSNEWSKNVYEKEVAKLPPGSADDIEGAGAAKKDSAWRKKRQLNPLRWQKVPPVPEKQSVSGEEAAGFFSKLTLSWIGPLMKV